MVNKKKQVQNSRDSANGDNEEKPKRISNNPSLKKQVALASFILGLIAFLLYINTLKNDFVLDDTSAIQYNAFVKKGFKGIPKILSTEYRAGYWGAKGNLYRPLPLVVFAVIWKFYPDNPAPFHLINCIFFGMTASLLFLLLRKLLKKFSILIPIGITLLFIIHPIHTEVVANIKSLDELLSLFFVLLGSLALLNFIQTKNKLSLVFLALCYFLALTSKEGAITFIIIFPMMMYFFTDANRKDYILCCSFFSAAAIIYLLIRANVLDNQTGPPYTLQVVDNSIIAAKDFGEKTASCFSNLGRYLLMSIYPQPLSIDYSYNQIPISNWTSLSAIISLVVYILLGIIVLLRFRLKEAWVFGIIFYLITISLYSNLFYTIGTNFAERLLYIPSLGICMAFVLLLNKFIPASKQVNQSAPGMHPLVLSLILILSVAGGVKTFSRNLEWKNLLRLCQTDLLATPKSAHLNYWAGKSIADDLQDNKFAQNERKKYSDLAISYFTKSIEIYPSYSDAYANRGKQYMNQNIEDKALADYKKSVIHGVSIWGVYADLGAIYFNRNQADTAIYYLKKGLSIDKNQTELYRYLGVIYQREQKYEEAINYLKQAIAIDNSQALLYKDLANNFHLKAQFDDALFYYLEALKRIKPSEMDLKKDIYLNLSKVYSAKGDMVNSNKYKVQ